MITYGNKYYVTFVIKYSNMKERLIQLLDLEQLSPSKFADLIGVQRSSISHVISGRNKPSFDFLEKTLKAFPGLNAAWLILGEGTMYEQMGRKVSGNLFDAQVREDVQSEERISSPGGPVAEISAPEDTVSAASTHENSAASLVSEDDKKAITLESVPELDEGNDKKRIVQVMLIYEDDTFKTFMPAN